MSRSLFLDFDGVLLDNKQANQLVSDKVTRFVSKKTRYPIRHAKMINDHFYPIYGHTTKFLNATKLSKDVVTVKEFNEFVYDEETMQQVPNLFGHEDIELYNQWASAVCRLEVDQVHIFSNAPRIWIETCLESIQKHASSCICFSSIVSVPEEKEGLMKPHYHTYEYMEEIAGKGTDIIFVDDNKANFFDCDHVHNVLYGSYIPAQEFTCIMKPDELTVRPFRK